VTTPELNILSAMITPAVLISACGTLILSTSNRLSRAVDRLRRSSERILTLSRADQQDEDTRLELNMLDGQIPRVMRRVHLIHRSLAAFYGAVGLFVLSSLVIGGSGLVRLEGDLIPILLSLSGTVLLSYGAVLLLIESQLSLSVSLEEMQFIRDLSHRRALGDA